MRALSIVAGVALGLIAASPASAGGYYGGYYTGIALGYRGGLVRRASLTPTSRSATVTSRVRMTMCPAFARAAVSVLPHRHHRDAERAAPAGEALPLSADDCALRSIAGEYATSLTAICQIRSG